MSTSGTGTHRSAAAAATAVAVALLLSACGGGSSTAGTSSSAGASSAAGTAGSAGASTGGTSTADTLAKLEQATETYPVPTTPVPGVAQLKGRTVYYVPITQQAPQFAVSAVAFKAALGKVGLNLQTCNGGGTPTTISACITQATKAGAAAIVTDAYPYGMAANALGAAQAAGIPVINANQVPDQAHPASAKLGYIYAPGAAAMVALATWIADDSKGKASVVVNQNADGPAPAVFGAAGKAEFAKLCSGCTWSVNGVSTANFPLVASSTSSALLKTPGVNYVVVQFEQFLQPTLGGVQQAGKAASVKGVAGAAELTSLQMLANKNFLYAAVGQDSTYEGWAYADAVLRMLTGTTGDKLPDYAVPIRLFTRDNVAALNLTEAAQSSGEWFGKPTYVDSFAALWGVS